jgi:hypothetical protein
MKITGGNSGIGLATRLPERAWSSLRAALPDAARLAAEA